jgi:hypothetical protein
MWRTETRSYDYVLFIMWKIIQKILNNLFFIFEVEDLIIISP